MNENYKIIIDRLLRTGQDGFFEVFKPEKSILPMRTDYAVIVLQGSLDLFIAERRDNQEHGRPVVLCTLTSGSLIPPFPDTENLLVYARCLPDTQIAYIQWTFAVKSEIFPYGTACFSECAGWHDVPESPEDFLNEFIRMCRNTGGMIAEEEAETRNLIQENVHSQQIRENSVFQNLTSLFVSKSSRPVAFDKGDPVAAAATRAAFMSGLSEFTLEEGDTVRKRLEKSMSEQRLRITPATLEKDWFKLYFFPTLLISKDGEDAYCAYRNRHNDGVAWSGATGKTYVLDRKFCETVEDTGWNFVKPFPKGEITFDKFLKFSMSFCKKSILLMLMLVLSGVILEMAVPVVNSMIFSDVIPNSNRTLLGLLFSLLLVTASSKAFLEIASTILTWRIMECIQLPLQLAVFDRVMRLPVNFFRNEAPGKMAQKIEALPTFFSNVSSDFILWVVRLIFVIIPVGMIFYYSADMALVILPIYIILFFVLVLCSCFIRRYYLQDLQKQSEVTGVLESFVSGISKLRSAGAEKHAMLAWSRKMTEEKALYKKFYRWNLILNFSYMILPWCVFCASTAWIVWSYLDGQIGNRVSLSDFTGFVSAVGILNAMLVDSFIVYSCFLKGFATFEWVRPLLGAKEEEHVVSFSEDSEIHGAVRLDNLSFAYEPEHPILKNVSIHAEPGEFIAITGESGAGKSTMLRLMLRFERPTSGTVLYDEEDVESKNMQRIRSQLGIVLQNANLLPDSILNNITGMSAQYTEADAWRAAEMAGCADDIRSFPMQMQTILASSSISGGQKQRILLAHALIRNPKIIFLDEATSALDNCVQRHIIESLQKIKATKVVIAHRLSTIKDADRIYVLEKGSVVETGTYRELIEKQGVFAEMAKRQLITEQMEG